MFLTKIVCLFVAAGLVSALPAPPMFPYGSLAEHGALNHQIGAGSANMYTTWSPSHNPHEIAYGNQHPWEHVANADHGYNAVITDHTGAYHPWYAVGTDQQHGGQVHDISHSQPLDHIYGHAPDNYAQLAGHVEHFDHPLDTVGQPHNDAFAHPGASSTQWDHGVDLSHSSLYGEHSQLPGHGTPVNHMSTPDGMHLHGPGQETSYGYISHNSFNPALQQHGQFENVPNLHLHAPGHEMNQVHGYSPTSLSPGQHHADASVGHGALGHPHHEDYDSPHFTTLTPFPSSLSDNYSRVATHSHGHETPVGHGAQVVDPHATDATHLQYPGHHAVLGQGEHFANAYHQTLGQTSKNFVDLTSSSEGHQEAYSTEGHSDAHSSPSVGHGDSGFGHNQAQGHAGGSATREYPKYINLDSPSPEHGHTGNHRGSPTHSTRPEASSDSDLFMQNLFHAPGSPTSGPVRTEDNGGASLSTDKRNLDAARSTGAHTTKNARQKTGGASSRDYA